MFKNNNTGIIRKFTKKSIKANNTRNIFLMLSIVVVTTMLMIVFGCGFSLTKNFAVAQDRFKGTLSSGMLTDVTAERYEILNTADYLSSAGIQQYAGQLADDRTDKMVVFTYYDQTEWKNHIVPAISQIEGHYPEQENEIMIPRSTASVLGFTDPISGDRLTLTFKDIYDKEHTIDFMISGIYSDYLGMNKSGSYGNTLAAVNFFGEKLMSVYPEGNIAVSQAFADKYAGEESQLVMISFKEKNIIADRALELLNNDIPAEDSLYVWGLQREGIVNLIIPYLFVAVLVMLVIVCGYLLIYNIISISVVREMHTYGQLKTLGATSGQLRRIVLGQAVRLSAIAIPAGLILGAAVSVAAVPVILNSFLEGNGMGEAMQTSVNLSPFLFISVAAFTLVTVIISSMKPARLAGKVSPVEAVRYQDGAAVQGRIKKSAKQNSATGNRLSRMAFRNVFRSKKRAIVVFLSLFLGLFMYLVVNVLTYGIDLDTKFERELPENFKVKNYTMLSEDENQWKHKFDRDFINEASGIQGIESVHEINAVLIELESASGNLKNYQKEREDFYETRQIKNAFLVGVDWEMLENIHVYSTYSNEQVQQMISDGSGVILEDTEQARAMIGEEIVLNNTSYIVAGITEETDTKAPQANNYISFLVPEVVTIEPIILAGQAGLIESGGEIFTEHIKIFVEDGVTREAERDIQEQILAIISDDNEISMKSQLLDIDTYTPVFQVIKIIGNVFSGILLMLGILNFVNVMITSIYSRQKEMAALESIGMTRKQMRKTLTLEGIYYCVFTLILVATLGSALSYGILVLARNILYYFVFGFPVGAIGILAVLLALVCAVTPNIAYRGVAKESVVERLRKGVD